MFRFYLLLFFFFLNNNLFLIIIKGSNTCTCNSGYKGPTCDTFDCSLVSNCNSRGSCDGKNLNPKKKNFKIFFFLKKKLTKKDQITVHATLDIKEQAVKILIVL
jgi:hypothetical protein